ncbi:hypothetical protein SPRG_06310 [Saprolegnia parasitica CBS 223.65]|uniref:Uncharacterized protein n=1 Tax=Saprolegnia parasitica (strain CBS 223.65) TaxID=695850 RepID=A0A067CBY6_SAPPC|nr:hypothetical protein SPRG_06310 [Saprolegnia parasitica CBS 223.65]KDO28259.1 hypothetical protein SPRG_06310 [Saprolegnia parasitica CBS 223.65]|eukprot:XP_012201081.1 hypothetical protein SPRG_06310 [Saprolegnia parasitica CBS 223.65]
MAKDLQTPENDTGILVGAVLLPLVGCSRLLVVETSTLDAYALALLVCVMALSLSTLVRLGAHAPWSLSPTALYEPLLVQSLSRFLPSDYLHGTSLWPLHAALAVYNLLLRYGLAALPRSLTFGEAMVLSQGMSLVVVDSVFYTLQSMALFDAGIPTLQATTIVIQLVLVLGVALGVLCTPLFRCVWAVTREERPASDDHAYNMCARQDAQIFCALADTCPLCDVPILDYLYSKICTSQSGHVSWWKSHSATHSRWNVCLHRNPAIFALKLSVNEDDEAAIKSYARATRILMELLKRLCLLVGGVCDVAIRGALFEREVYPKTEALAIVHGVPGPLPAFAVDDGAAAALFVSVETDLLAAADDVPRASSASVATARAAIPGVC